MNLKLYEKLKKLSEWDCSYSNISPLVEFLNLDPAEMVKMPGELPLLKSGRFLLRRAALLHLLSTSVNSGCSNPTEKVIACFL